MNGKTRLLYKLLFTCIFLMIVSCSSPTFTNYAVSRGAGTASVSLIVLDSLNGSPVSGATISVKDSTGASVAIPASTTDNTGTVESFTLTSGASYTISATKSSLAASAMQDFIATDGATIALYCHTLGIKGVASTAPIIENIEYSTDGGATWPSLDPGAKVNGSFKIRVSVVGSVAVKATSLSGFGIGIALDAMPTATRGYNTTSYPQLVSTAVDAVPVSTVGPTNGWFQTTVVFDLFGETFLAGSHTLELVAYDVANNRVEKRVPFTLN